VKITSPQDLFPENQSPLTSPSREEALHDFQNFNPSRYAQTRNFLNGQVSRMSVHIKHGVIQNQELLKIIRDKFSFLESEKFIQELAWRDFWRSYAYHHPDQLGWMWKNTKQDSPLTTTSTTYPKISPTGKLPLRSSIILFKN
jgi:deoxyribodipyrimidine photolyase